jgi:hypothetical protein
MRVHPWGGLDRSFVGAMHRAKADGLTPKKQARTDRPRLPPSPSGGGPGWGHRAAPSSLQARPSSPKKKKQQNLQTNALTELLNGLIQHPAHTSTLQPLKPRTFQSDTT